MSRRNLDFFSTYLAGESRPDAVASRREGAQIIRELLAQPRKLPYKTLWRKAYFFGLAEEAFVAAMKELRRKNAIRFIMKDTADPSNPDVFLIATGDLIRMHDTRAIPNGISDVELSATGDLE